MHRRGCNNDVKKADDYKKNRIGREDREKGR